MKHITYRKLRNRGYQPVWYHTNRGIIVAYIISRGRVWMKIGLTDGRTKKVRMSEERYMKEMINRGGDTA